MATKNQKGDVYIKIKKLFPLDYKSNHLCEYINYLLKVLEKNKKVKKDSPRILGMAKFNNKESEIIKRFSTLPEKAQDPLKSCESIIQNFFINIPRWRSPNLQYNVGTAVNSVAVAAYAIALEENIYNINDGLAGNALIAEQIVSNILSNLAGLDKKTRGFFTFGGTATNFYATKIGLKKAVVNSSKVGIPKKIRVMITEDSHFSHKIAADWLGIGTNNVLIINSNKDRTSNLLDAKKKLIKAFESKKLVSSIIINGGTTYGHVIDDILSFVKLRDEMVKKFSLNYNPHIHVDSVIGWAWLFFNNYNFKKNKLRINLDTLRIIKKQYRKISQVKYADSWGVDFHKGVGGCPISCSMFIINNSEDLQFLSKKEGGIDMHQLATEFSLKSPADFTIETSRSAGPPLSALASLLTLGKEGYQRNLSNLIELSLMTKNLVSEFSDIQVCHEDSSLGYVTMLRVYPPELKDSILKKKELTLITKSSKEIKKFINDVNNYMKAFFTWDKEKRMSKNEGVEYSFSSGYLKLKNGCYVSGIKLYPVSPHFTKKHVKDSVSIIVSQKRYFDKNIWKRN